MRLRLCVVGVLLGGLLAASTEVVILRPVADTTLFETYPSNNLGRVQSLAAGTTAHTRRSRALLRFDVTGAIPSNATVLSAAVTLKVVRTPPGGGVDSTFRLHRMLRGWTEGDKSTPANGSLATTGETTWLASAYPAVLWSAPGAAASGFRRGGQRESICRRPRFLRVFRADGRRAPLAIRPSAATQAS